MYVLVFVVIINYSFHLTSMFDCKPCNTSSQVAGKPAQQHPRMALPSFVMTLFDSASKVPHILAVFKLGANVHAVPARTPQGNPQLLVKEPMSSKTSRSC